MLRLTAVRGSGALYVSGVAKRPPRQKQAAERAERARRRQRGRRDGLTSGGSADLVEYRGWVGSVLERARRELGVGDSAWSQIEHGPRGAPRRRAEFEDAVETRDPEGSEGLPLGAPEDEPDAGRRRLAAKVEQEPGRPGAEERRAAQVEHEPGVAAEPRAELGLELAGAPR